MTNTSTRTKRPLMHVLVSIAGFEADVIWERLKNALRRDAHS